MTCQLNWSVFTVLLFLCRGFGAHCSAGDADPIYIYVELTEKIYFSSTLAFLGFVLMLSIIRSLNIRAEAARVMVAAPVITFTTTHILFLNLVEFDYGWNLGVIAVLATAQLLFWVIFGIRSHQPSCWKLWFSVIGAALAMLLEVNTVKQTVNSIRSAFGL